MVKSEAPEASPELEALEAAFYDWWADNSEALANGYCGDVLGLRLALNAASANATTSSLEHASADQKSLESFVSDLT